MKTIIPKIGEKVTVVLSHRSILLPTLFPDLLQTLTYVGEVQPSASYDPPDSFRMSGDTNMPVRVVGTKNILLYNNLKVKVQGHNAALSEGEKSVKPSTFIVEGSKGNQYTVTVFEDGTKTCTCKGFGYGNICRHIRENT